MKDFNKKKILITGSASGIGKSLASKFSRLGASLILVDIKYESSDHTNSKIILIKCDFGKKKEIDRIPDSILSDVDILINNAGIGAKGFFVDENFDEFERILDVNFRGLAYLTKRYLNCRKHNKESFIVNTCSIAGVIPVPYMGAYSSSKAAVYNFTRLLSVELHNTKVKAMAAICGPAKTNFGKEFKNKISHSKFYENHIMLTPDKVAEEIISGIKKKKKFVFIPGYLKYIALLSNMFPKVYDLFFANSLRNMKIK